MLNLPGFAAARYERELMVVSADAVRHAKL